MRIRRLSACPCSGSSAQSFSTLFTNKSPITPELLYLTARMAALLAFGKAADFLGELLALSAQATASTVRNRTMLAHTLLETIRYPEMSADSMPDYGKRYRAGQRISTGFVEPALSEIIAKRIIKKQQMRWNRYAVRRFSNVRVHGLNGTLQDEFRHWHKGFRPVDDQAQLALSA